jgi:O-antigen/teichoic acid export membrane protein
MNLNLKIIDGGKVLVIANTLASILASITALAYAQLIGIDDFAIYILCGSFVGVLKVFSRAGANARLLTKPTMPSNFEYESALGLMLVASIITCSAFIAILPIIGDFSNTPDIFWPAFISTMHIPLYVVGLPAICRLEKTLSFDRIVRIELISQITGMVIGIAIAFLHNGLWAPIIGSLAREATQTLLSWKIVGLHPKCRWNRRYAIKTVLFSLNQLVATALVQGRNSIFLMLTAYFFDKSAVGYIGICQRVMNLASPLRYAISRIMLPYFAGLKKSPAFLRAAIRSTNELEVLLTVPIYIAICYCFAELVKLSILEKWLPSINYFPWICASMVIQVVHGIELTALHAGRKFLASSVASICIILTYVLIFFLISRFSFSNPAFAAVAVWPAFFLQDYLCNIIFKIKFNAYKYIWCISGVIGCLSIEFGITLLSIPIAVLFLTKKQIRVSFSVYSKDYQK